MSHCGQLNICGGTIYKEILHGNCSTLLSKKSFDTLNFYRGNLSEDKNI